MMTTDEAAARLTREIADCRGQGYIDASLVRLSLGDVAQVLATNAALRDQLARAEAVPRLRVCATGYVETDGRASVMTTDRTAECPHCGGPLVLPAPFRQVDEDEYSSLSTEPDEEDAALAARTPTPGAAGEVG